MSWIKKHWDQFLLVLAAVLLLVCSALLIMRAMQFSDVFASIRGDVAKSTEIAPIEVPELGQANAAFTAPPQWTVESGEGSLFISDKYIVVDGQLRNPLAPGSQPIHGKVPNDWFVKFDLPILETDVLSQDPDGDKFNNLEEFQAKTDPVNVEEHPPFWMKLRLKEFIQVKFRLLFSAYTGDPLDPSSHEYQLNTLDVSQPTQFLKIGDAIAGTKFTIESFEYKTFINDNNVKRDISELKVVNSETGEKVALVLEKIADSPDSYALFRYLWDGSEIKVKENADFKLEPEKTEYKLIDIQSSEAVIENLQTGSKHTIPKMEKGSSQ